MSERWPRVRLGEVLTQDREYVTELEPRLYPKLSVRLYGRGVYLDTPADGASVLMNRHQFAKPGQVILSEIWAKKGAIGLVPDVGAGALVTSHFFLFDVRCDRALREYIDWFLRANYFEAQLSSEARGTTGYAAIRPAQFLSCEISLPPLPEQRRIVARIEEVASRIGEARTLREQAAKGIAAIQRACSEAQYRQLAEKCGTRPIGDVCATLTDGDHVTPKFSESGVRFIFVGNVSSGRLHFADTKFVSADYFATLKPQRVPKRGDILYSAVGATLGIPAIVDTDEPFCFQRHVAILKPNRGQLDSCFAWHMLGSRTVFERAWGSTTGSAQPTVPLRAIRNLQIPVPSLSEQRRTADYLDTLQAKADALTLLQAETCAELDALLPAVLDRAFKGEL